MFRNAFRYVALVGAIGLGACDLEVENPNDPDTRRVLATPADAEALLGGYYKRWHNAMYNGNPPGNFEGMANIMSFQNYSSLANNCQNARAPFAGVANTNTPGNVCAGEQNSTYSIHSEVARVASSFLRQMDDAVAGGGSFLGTPARDGRARSYAEFLRGVSFGYMAMFYDSAAVPSAQMAGDDPGVLLNYLEVADSAYAALQRASDIALATPAGGDGFPLPFSWLPSPTTFTAAEFSKLIRSYRARFMAGMGRTPTERAAANWTEIIADAAAGITADHMNTTSTTGGPFGGWRRIGNGAGLWHQMPPFIIGMGDTSGTYAAWIAQPVGERGAGNQSFFMVTPDLRFPQGETRAAQRADFLRDSCNAASTPCERYFVNRDPGGDQFSGLGWGWSNYDFVRFNSWVVSGDGTGLNGNLVFMDKTEIDMIRAEGLIRAGQYQAAADLINLTRVPNGLPAVSGTADGGAALTGNACVPKRPTPAGTVICGDLMEAMKWEKRIETSYTHFAAWWIDHRGWGDLAEGLPLFWAVPYQDLQARGYSTGQLYGAGPGVGMAPNSVAGPSTYGW